MKKKRNKEIVVLLLHKFYALVNFPSTLDMHACTPSLIKATYSSNSNKEETLFYLKTMTKIMQELLYHGFTFLLDFFRKHFDLFLIMKFFRLSSPHGRSYGH